jgi:hypothetical protein
MPVSNPVVRRGHPRGCRGRNRSGGSRHPSSSCRRLLDDQAFATVIANTVGDMEINKSAVLVSVMAQGDPSLLSVTFAALTTLGKAIIGPL